MRCTRVVTGMIVVAMSVGAAGCSRPDLNAPVRVTGDREAAVPTTDATTTTIAPDITTTTLFYGSTSTEQDG